MLLARGRMEKDEFNFEQDWCTEMPVVNLDTLEIPQSVLKLVHADWAKRYRVVPVEFKNNVLVIAMSDPQNVNALDDLAFMLNVKVNGAIAREEQVNAAIKRFYGVGE